METTSASGWGMLVSNTIVGEPLNELEKGTGSCCFLSVIIIIITRY